MFRAGPRWFLTVAVVTLLLVVAGCGQAGTPASSLASPVTEAEARAMSERMLAAFNAGDYAEFSHDWSPAMREGIPETAFRAFRDETLPVSGKFVSLDTIVSRPGQSAGVVRWESTCTFEKGTFVLMIAFKEGSKLIEGNTLTAAP
jgi:hypothetical protein